MEIKIKPWNGSERLYFYRQSQQLAGQTGQIGKLRADFDRDGNGFFSSWEDIRNHLKTEEFKQTFDDVINELRFGDGEAPFHRYNFFGIADEEKLPDWAKEKLRQMTAPESSGPVQSGISGFFGRFTSCIQGSS